MPDHKHDLEERRNMRRHVVGSFCLTGKKRIRRKDAQLRLAEDGLGNWVLVAETLRFTRGGEEYERYGFPPAARIIVEGRGRTIYERVEWGTVQDPGGNKRPIAVDPALLRVFRLIVVDAEEDPGRVLGECPSVLQSREDEHRSYEDALLPVRRTRKIGELPWKIEWAEREGRLELCLNSRISDILDRLHGDPIFQALVLPAALEEVLKSVARERVHGTGQWEEKWADAWLRWGEELADRTPPDADADEEEWDDWVVAVVEAFAEEHGFVRNWPGVTGPGGNER